MVRNELLELIREHPGKTARELREMTDHSLGAIHKGLTDLCETKSIAGANYGDRFEWRAIKNA